MKNKIFILMGVLLLGAPVLLHAEQSAGKENDGFRVQQKAKITQHREAQKQKNQAFRETLKGKTAEERAAAVKSHKEAQYQENKAFREQIHQENMSHLKDLLAKNEKLTDAQRNELVDFYEKQYQENVAHHQKQHEENMAFLDQISANPNLTQEQRKEAIKEHFKAQKEENQEQRKGQSVENKAEKEKIHSQLKVKAKTQETAPAASVK